MAHRTPASKSSRLKRRKIIRRWALWMPTAIVILTCVFFDEAWAFASHILHPHSGMLIGYRVSIPLSWTVSFDQFVEGDNAHSIVVAQRYRGLLRAGMDLHIGRRPPLSISTMDFRSTLAGDPPATKPDAEIISTRTLPFDKGAITCWEEPPPSWMGAARCIWRSTPRGDFSGGFKGEELDALEFYRTLKANKPTRVK